MYISFEHIRFVLFVFFSSEIKFVFFKNLDFICKKHQNEEEIKFLIEEAIWYVDNDREGRV